MKRPTILFSGGGTGGSVAPLLAVAEVLRAKEPSLNMHWVGTRSGPEQAMVKHVGMTFTSISWAKLRRSIDPRNLFIPFWFALAFVQSFFFLLGLRPRVVVTAGGFVAVPLVWAAWVLRIPSVVHQQDVRPGLANKLMAPLAREVTVVFKRSLKDFPNAKVIGNPVRDMTPTTKMFSFHKKKPVVLIMGGGTGARAINALVTKDLLKVAQVVHLTGDRGAPKIDHADYHSYPFLEEELKEAMSAADMVVTRAGMSTLSELASLKKPAIVIPIPHSHQEENAALLKKKDAAIVLSQEGLDVKGFTEAIESGLKDKKMRARGERLRALFGENATDQFVKLLAPYIGLTDDKKGDNLAG